MVPGHLVTYWLVPLDKWSPKIWFPLTNDPWKFCPHGQIVPNQIGPPRQMVPKIFCLSKGTGWGDLEIRGPNWLGTICPGGPNASQPYQRLFSTFCSSPKTLDLQKDKASDVLEWRGNKNQQIDTSKNRHALFEDFCQILNISLSNKKQNTTGI